MTMVSNSYFTLRSTPDVQNKHTIFGKVTGKTIYNILKLEEALVDENDRPLYPPRLIKTIILNNPFPDIIPRIIVQESEEVKDNSETKTAARFFNLLSFGKKAKEDDEECVILNKKFNGKGKSAHDHLTDPKLSSQPAVEPFGLANKKRTKDRSSDWESDGEVKAQEELQVIKKEKELVYCLHYDYFLESKFQEAFQLFDSRGDGKIHVAQIGDALRALGQNPTESDVKKFTHQHKPDERISFEVFLPIYQAISKSRTSDTADDFIEGLRHFDKDGNGFISSAELRHLLTTLGEKLSDEEVETLLAGHEDSQGNINYEDFVRQVMCG
ncbi:Myosin-2 essential light chain [Eufriesea mexicana]|uniref:Myosin-2 essential light chain n=3 Tax=Apocrita TaxID=7400 RepID=A0A310S7B5_9HYME|nr:Myosin-2 essential light chain [Eufriesea mexicana]